MSTNLQFTIVRGTLSDASDLREAFGERVHLVETEMQASGAALAASVAGSQGLVVALHQLHREHFEALAGQVRVVGRLGIGLDTIDLEAAREFDVAVIHQPDYGTREVANHAVTLLLAAQRKVIQSNRDARGPWLGRRALGDIRALDELSIGIVGCGRIGRAVIDRVRPFFREIVAYDPLPQELPSDVIVTDTLEELLERCACVTLHVPLTPETENLISSDELAMMPAGSVLINVSRGGLVDESALARALTSGHIAGAGLDVLTSEPPTSDNPILWAPNVVLTSHVAWYSVESERRCKHNTISDMIAYLDGNPTIGRLAVDPHSAR